jgi:hypothetical protein
MISSALKALLLRDPSYRHNPQRRDWKIYERCASDLAARVLYREHLRHVRAHNARPRKKPSRAVEQGNEAWRALE